MITWTGWGFAAVLIPIATMMVVTTLGIFIHAMLPFLSIKFIMFTGYVSGALIVWFLGKRLNGKPAQILVDPKTQQHYEFKPSHTLFFIKMQYWAFIIIAFGLYDFLFNP